MLKLDILVHPSSSEPELAPEPKRKLPKKWRFPWRINMLALPKAAIKKYEPPTSEPSTTTVSIDRETEFRCDHLARPYIRILQSNKESYKDRGPNYVKNVMKNLGKSWDSIYNYYRKKLREKELKRLKHKRAILKAKKLKGKSLEEQEALREEHFVTLAKPKKLFPPEELPRKWKALDELAPDIDILAAPKEYHIVPPRVLGKVSSKALVYEITENVLRLAKIPDRMKKRASEPCIPGAVKKSALTAMCTPRIEKLAEPSTSAQEAKKHEEDKYDPWIISPNALKYKPTARILELAKPVERE